MRARHVQTHSLLLACGQRRVALRTRRSSLPQSLMTRWKALRPTPCERELGAHIAALVSEVTDDKSLPKQRRNQLQIDHAPMKSKGAVLIKVADKLCNLRDLLASSPKHWTAGPRQEYRQWASKVVAALPLGRHRLKRVFTGELNGSRSLYSTFPIGTRAHD
jgi:hypothetical protein